MKSRHNAAAYIPMMKVLKLPPFDGRSPISYSRETAADFVAYGSLFEILLGLLLKAPESTRKNSALISTGAISVLALYLYSDTPTPNRRNDVTLRESVRERKDREFEKYLDDTMREGKVREQKNAAIALGAGALLAGLFDHFYLTPHYLKKIEDQASLEKKSQKPSGT